MTTPRRAAWRQARLSPAAPQHSRAGPRTCPPSRACAPGRRAASVRGRSSQAPRNTPAIWRIAFFIRSSVTVRFVAVGGHDAHAGLHQVDDAQLLGHQVAGEAAGIFDETTRTPLPSDSRAEKPAALDRIGAARRRVVEPVSVVDHIAGSKWKQAPGQAAAANCLRQRRPCQRGGLPKRISVRVAASTHGPHAPRLSARLASVGAPLAITR
jgi:hypothetical protein